METYCKIRELRDGLEIRVDRKGSSRIAIGVAAVLISVFGLSAASYFHRPALVVPLLLIFVAMLVAGVVAKQGAKLQVTKVELIGTSPRRGKSGGGEFRLNTADVRWLEYRDMDAFGIRGLGASGLYAVKSIGATRVLPFVDLQETSIIIEAIETKFPGLAEMWRSNLNAESAAKGTGNKS